MSKVRLMLLGLLTMLTISAIASSSASAHNYKIEGTEIKESSSVEGKSGVSNLASKIAGLKIVIRCTKDKFKGKIEVKAKSTASIEFEECKLFEENASKELKELSACKVKVPTTSVKDELTETPVKDLFTPEKGEEFTKIEITGETCVLKGKYEITGSQKCELPEAGSSKIEHTIECKPSGSSLFLKKEAATFESTEKEIKIVGGGKKWSAE